MKARQLQKRLSLISIKSHCFISSTGSIKALTLTSNGCLLPLLLFLLPSRLKLIQERMLGYCTSCFFRCCGFLALTVCVKRLRCLGAFSLFLPFLKSVMFGFLC